LGPRLTNANLGSPAHQPPLVPSSSSEIGGPGAGGSRFGVVWISGELGITLELEPLHGGLTKTVAAFTLKRPYRAYPVRDGYLGRCRLARPPTSICPLLLLAGYYEAGLWPLVTVLLNMLYLGEYKRLHYF